MCREFPTSVSLLSTVDFGKHTFFKRRAHQVFKQRFCTIIDISNQHHHQHHWHCHGKPNFMHIRILSHLQVVRLLADDFCLLQKQGQSFLLLLHKPVVKGLLSPLLRPPPRLLLLWLPLLKAPGLTPNPTNTSPLAMFGKLSPLRELWTMKGSNKLWNFQNHPNPHVSKI